MRLRRRDLDVIFSLQHERTVNQDNTVQLDNRIFQIEKTGWRHTLAGAPVVLHEHLDGRISIRYGPHLIAEYDLGCTFAHSPGDEKVCLPSQARTYDPSVNSRDASRLLSAHVFVPHSR